VADQPKKDNTAGLVIGILLAVLGGWLLIDRIAAPVIAPLSWLLELIDKIALPAVLIAAGIALIMIASRRDIFTNKSGKKLMRSRDDRWIAGVLGGVAEHFGWDATLTRVIFILFALLTKGGTALVAYIIAAIIIPEAPASGVAAPPPPGSQYPVAPPTYPGPAPYQAPYEAGVSPVPAPAPTAPSSGPSVLPGAVAAGVTPAVPPAPPAAPPVAPPAPPAPPAAPSEPEDAVDASAPTDAPAQ
jgi:phage shock protein PspC (stress-responsive transcriptional regulator)